MVTGFDGKKILARYCSIDEVLGVLNGGELCFDTFSMALIEERTTGANFERAKVEEMDISSQHNNVRLSQKNFENLTAANLVLSK